MTKEEIKVTLNVIDALYHIGLNEGRELFPHHPKAQEVWAKLYSGRGGIEPTVEILGLQKEYSEYRAEINRSWDNISNDIIALKIDGFVQFCKDHVKENFFMFK